MKYKLYLMEADNTTRSTYFKNVSFVCISSMLSAEKENDKKRQKEKKRKRK